MGQHGEAGALLLAGVRAAALLVVHHQQVVEVHFGVYGLCGEEGEDSRAERTQEGKRESHTQSTTMAHYSSMNRRTLERAC